MKIAIDISPLHHFSHGRGIGVYTTELYRALKDVDDGNEYELIQKKRSYDADVIHYPFFDLFFPTLPFIKPRPTVVTIHDVIPLVYPDAYPPGIRGKLKFAYQKNSLSSAQTIVTDSQVSRQDIIKHLKVPQDKVEAVYLGVNTDIFNPSTEAQMSQVKKRFSLDTPYLLYVGDINFNKNIPQLITSFKELDTQHRLVLVSAALSNPIKEAREIHQLILRNKLEERVVVLPRVELEELVALYSGAEWYIQPSLYEGFGLPVLEAMACHTPVVSSSGGSLGELFSDATLMFVPKTEESKMYSALKEAVSMTKSEREIFVKKGIQKVSKLTWHETASKMSQIYRKAIS